jgi:hypothetical protein
MSMSSSLKLPMLTPLLEVLEPELELELGPVVVLLL